MTQSDIVALHDLLVNMFTSVFSNNEVQSQIMMSTDSDPFIKFDLSIKNKSLALKKITHLLNVLNVHSVVDEKGYLIVNTSKLTAVDLVQLSKFSSLTWENFCKVIKDYLLELAKYKDYLLHRIPSCRVEFTESGLAINFRDKTRMSAYCTIFSKAGLSFDANDESSTITITSFPFSMIDLQPIMETHAPAPDRLAQLVNQIDEAFSGEGCEQIKDQEFEYAVVTIPKPKSYNLLKTILTDLNCDFSANDTARQVFIKSSGTFTEAAFWNSFFRFHFKAELSTANIMSLKNQYPQYLLPSLISYANSNQLVCGQILLLFSSFYQTQPRIFNDLELMELASGCFDAYKYKGQSIHAQLHIINSLPSELFSSHPSFFTHILSNVITVGPVLKKYISSVSELVDEDKFGAATRDYVRSLSHTAQMTWQEKYSDLNALAALLEEGVMHPDKALLFGDRAKAFKPTLMVLRKAGLDLIKRRYTNIRNENLNEFKNLLIQAKNLPLFAMHSRAASQALSSVPLLKQETDAIDQIDYYLEKVEQMLNPPLASFSYPITRSNIFGFRAAKMHHSNAPVDKSLVDKKPVVNPPLVVSPDQAISKSELAPAFKKPSKFVLFENYHRPSVDIKNRNLLDDANTSRIKVDYITDANEIIKAVLISSLTLVDSYSHNDKAHDMFITKLKDARRLQDNDIYPVYLFLERITSNKYKKSSFSLHHLREKYPNVTVFELVTISLHKAKKSESDILDVVRALDIDFEKISETLTRQISKMQDALFIKSECHSRLMG